jgi:phosphatidylserine decarboxylase
MFHKEGKYIIPGTLLLSVGLLYFINWLFNNEILFYTLLVAALIFNGLILNFFRTPKVNIPVGESNILSPCNGKVVVIEEVLESKYFKEKRIQISVFMSPLDVHVNRSPIRGKIIKSEYYPGKFLVAWHPKSSEENEQTFFVVENPKLSVAFKQIAGALARRICWYVNEGDSMQEGQEFGFIRFGSRMDILVPVNTEIKVQLGQKVTGGETILGIVP